MIRYRIWHLLALSSLVLVAGCKPLPQDQADRNRVLQQSPNISHPLAIDGSVAVAGAAEAAGDVRTVKVGLLLPLTGRNAELGKAMQDAATVSLFDKYASLSVRQQNIRLELLPRDTGDSPQQVMAAMNQAVADGAQFIIGPLFSDATEAIAPIAQAKNISVLSLSSNRARAQNNIYTFGFAPQEQTRRVVSYALRHNKTRIAVLVPDSALGNTVLTAAVETIKAAGQNVVAQAKYQPLGTGVESAMSQLIPPGSKPNFDALLIPEGGPALDVLLRALQSRGVTPANTQFLGTGLWDDATLLRRVGLNGAWLASSPPTLTAQFEDRFRTTYHYTPPRIASLSYDAVALAVTLITSGRGFEARYLTNIGGFSGPANGIFRLKPNGLVERGLAVLQINGPTLEVIENPPTGFTN
ncbi:MAG: penicillin-binding protein activator [Rickettsiales bacterium]